MTWRPSSREIAALTSARHHSAGPGVVTRLPGLAVVPVSDDKLDDAALQSSGTLEGGRKPTRRCWRTKWRSCFQKERVGVLALQSGTGRCPLVSGQGEG